MPEEMTKGSIADGGGSAWDAAPVRPMMQLEALEIAIDETCSVTVAAEIRRRQAVLLRQ